MSDERADRLGAAVFVFGIVRGAPAGYADQLAACREADPEDRRIAYACLDAQYELRDLEWTALELLGAALHPTAPPEGAAGPRAAGGPTNAPTGAPKGAPKVWVDTRELADLALAVLGWDT